MTDCNVAGPKCPFGVTLKKPRVERMFCRARMSDPSIPDDMSVLNGPGIPVLVQGVVEPMVVGLVEGVMVQTKPTGQPSITIGLVGAVVEVAIVEVAAGGGT